MENMTKEKIQDYVSRIDNEIVELHNVRDLIVGIGMKSEEKVDILKVFNNMRDLNSAIKSLVNAKSSLESLIKEK